MVDFYSFHEGETLGLLERACIASFARHGHRFTLYSYRSLDVPEGVVLADARAIIPLSDYEAFFAQAPGRISQFSNGFRYAMLRAQGGWWVDTDVLCIDAAVPEGDIALGWAVAPDSRRLQRIGSAMMKLPPGHAVAQRAYELWKGLWADARWGVTGPAAVTKATLDLDLQETVMPFGTLFCCSWDEVLVFFDPNSVAEAQRLAQGSCFLHLANSGLGFQGLTRNILPPRGSYLRPHIAPLLSEAQLAEGDDRFVAALVRGLRTLNGQAGA